MPLSQALERRFDTRTDYRQAVLALLAHAQHELLILERDLSEADLGSREAYELLWAFFTRKPAGRMQVLVVDPEYLGKQCARFMQLRDHFSHRLTVCRLDHPEGWQQGFIIADRQTCLWRPHFDWPRGEISADGASVARLQQKFTEVWQESHEPGEWHSLNL